MVPSLKYWAPKHIVTVNIFPEIAIFLGIQYLYWSPRYEPEETIVSTWENGLYCGSSDYKDKLKIGFLLLWKKCKSSFFFDQETWAENTREKSLALIFPF